MTRKQTSPLSPARNAVGRTTLFSSIIMFSGFVAMALPMNPRYPLGFTRAVPFLLAASLCIGMRIYAIQRYRKPGTEETNEDQKKRKTSKNRIRGMGNAALITSLVGMMWAMQVPKRDGAYSLFMGKTFSFRNTAFFNSVPLQAGLAMGLAAALLVLSLIVLGARASRDKAQPTPETEHNQAAQPLGAGLGAGGSTEIPRAPIGAGGANNSLRSGDGDYYGADIAPAL